MLSRRLLCPTAVLLLQALSSPAVIISTLGLAVEWLLQAPPEARQGAMLQAAELLLSLLLVRHDQSSAPPAAPVALLTDVLPPAAPLGSPSKQSAATRPSLWVDVPGTPPSSSKPAETPKPAQRLAAGFGTLSPEPAMRSPLPTPATARSQSR